MAKNLENELLTQVEMLSNFGIWEMDLNTKQAIWSADIYKIFDLEQSDLELTFDSIVDLIHPDDREIAVSSLKMTIETGDGYNVVLRTILKGDRIKYVNSKANLVRDAEGKPFKIYGVLQDLTDVLLIEQSLKKTTSDLKALVENTPDVIYSVDLGFRILTYNSAFENIVRKLGLGKVVKGSNVFDFYGDEKRELYSAVFLIVKEGKRYVFEDELIVCGQSVFFEVSVNPIQDENEKVIGVSIFSKDVTEKNQKEKELERIKVNQDYIINGTSDLIWSINSKLELITANSAFFEIIEAITGNKIKPGDSVMIPHFRENENLFKIWSALYQRGLNGESFTENYHEDYQGTPNYSLISFVPMFNDKQEVWGVACYSKNVTKEKLSYLEIEKKEAELKRIMDSSMDVICTIDEFGNFKKVSAAAEKVWGYHPKEIEGKPYINLVHPDDQLRTSQAAKSIMEGYNTTSFENKYIAKDGKEVPIIWSVRWSKEDRIMYCVAKDATDLYFKDEQIRKTNDTLKNAQKLAKIGNYEFNLDKYEVFCSDEIYNIYEIDKNLETITNPKVFLEYTHPDDVENLIAFKNKLIETGEVSSVLHRIITKKNNIKYVRQVVELVYDETTKCKWLYGTIRDSTPNILVQQEIEKSNEKYRYLFDNNPSAMFIFDFRTLDIVDCNQEALDLYGYTKKEFLNLSIRDIRPPEDIELINIATQNEETYGQIHKNTWRHTKKNGELMYVNINGHLLDIDDRKCSLVQVTNITDKLEAEKAIKASEQKRELIMNAALDAIICIDRAGLVTFWNPQSEHIFGWKVNEIMGKSLTQLIVPNQHKKGHEAGMKHYLKTKEGPVLNKLLELSAINKDGIEFPIELTVIPIGQGEEEFFCAFIRDISSRKATEVSLKQSEEKYKLLFQNSPLPKWIYDLEDYRFLDVNDTAIKKYGYSREEFASMTIKEIRPKEDIPKLLNVHKKVENNNGVITFGIFNHQKKDQSIIKVEVSGQKITFQGKACMMVVCNDVTEREFAITQLKENEKKLLNAQKIAKLGYWQLNTKTNEIYWSNEVYQIWGKNTSDFKPTYNFYFDSIHPDDQLNFLNHQNNAVKNKTEIDFEHRIILEDGSIKWLHQRGEYISDENATIYLEGTLQDITKEKTLELSILESNQRYKYVTKATYDAIWDWNLLTDKLYWGDGFKKIFGYEFPDYEVDSHAWSNNIHPDDYERVINSIDLVFKSDTLEENWSDEYRFLKADGTYAYVQDKGIIIRNTDGEPIRMVGAMQDITQKKEENLRLHLLESVVTNTNDSVIITEAEVFDEAGPRILYVNEAFTRMTGYSSKEVIGKSPKILQGPKSDKKELQRLVKALKNWETCEITTVNYKKNGDEFYVNFSVTPVANADGWYTHWVALERDVTENVIAQQKLLSSYDERNTILESIDDGFFATDKNSIVTYWNKKAEILLGAKRDDVLGKNLHDMFSNPSSLAFHKHYQLAIKENKTIHFEEYSFRSKKWFEVSAFASDKGLSVYFKDITNKKQAETELIELNNMLLKQTKELSISNQELEQFAYVASHDLQEPLRMITSFLTQIEKKYNDIIDERGKQYIHFAVDGAKRMRQIILDLLEFSKVGRLSEDLEEVDVNELIKEIQSLYRKQIQELSATFELGDFPIVLSYKTPIRQILQNLISNALKYHNPERKAILKIDVIEDDKFWKFSVKDNGIGIDKDYFQKIFIIFQRLHNKDEYSGTGMGLAICKKIIESLGGEIWVENNIEQGSCFYFTIPKTKI